MFQLDVLASGLSSHLPCRHLPGRLLDALFNFAFFVCCFTFCPGWWVFFVHTIDLLDINRIYLNSLDIPILAQNKLGGVWEGGFYLLEQYNIELNYLEIFL